MSQVIHAVIATREQARVRKAMSHRPFLKLDDAIPADLMDKLLRLDAASQSPVTQARRD